MRELIRGSVVLLMVRPRGRWSTAVSLLTVLGLLAAGCTGDGGKPPGNASPTTPGTPGISAPADLPDVGFSTPRSEIPDPTPDVTASAQTASRTLADQMVPAIRSFSLDPSVSGLLVDQVAYVDAALQQGNLLGARSLLAAWAANAQKLTTSGVLSSAQDATFQNYSAQVESQLPETGNVTPFTEPDAPTAAQGDISVCQPGLIPPDALGGKGAFADCTVHIAKTFTYEALGQIPYVGWIAAGLLTILWPERVAEPVDPWGAIKGRVEALVDEKIAAAFDQEHRTNINNLLNATRDRLRAYVTMAQGSTNKAKIGQYWLAAENQLNTDYHQFRVNRGFVVLPEFAEVVNLYLGILRDGILNADGLDLDEHEVGIYKKYFTSSYSADGSVIDSADKWIKQEYPQGRKAGSRNAQGVLPEGTTLPVRCSAEDGGVTGAPGAHRLRAINGFPPYPETFPTGFRPPAKPTCSAYTALDTYNTVSGWDQFMIPAVSDQVFSWPYFDPAKCKTLKDCTVTVPPDRRVLWSTAYGSNFTGPGLTTTGAWARGGTPIAPPGQCGNLEELTSSRNVFPCPQSKNGPITKMIFYNRCGPPTALCSSPGTAPSFNVNYLKGWVVERSTTGSDFGGPGSADPANFDRNGTVEANVATTANGSPIVGVSGYASEVIEALKFTRADGSSIAPNGFNILANFGPNTAGRPVVFPGEVLTAIYSSTYNSEWGAPSVIVFGLRLADSY